MSCVLNNTEKHISFFLGQLRFIDSAQFLLASLDKLVAANPPGAFQITTQHEPNRERRELLMRKGVYPYEYMDTWDRFTEPKLPPKEIFYRKLSDAHISDDDYTHAQKVWATFGCKTLGDYSDLYCRTDVLLLADVFETFRKMCLRQYGLDPAHYYTSPVLSWDALLKKTGVELELLTDYDQHLFIERGMRGGISFVSKRDTKANNPVVDGYDPEKPSSHILYLDANNLCGWTISQPLPTGAFRWEEDREQLVKTIVDHPADDPERFILAVDLEYPEDLHNAHNTYPLAPNAWWFRKNGCQSISTASWALGWCRQRLRSWSQTSVTRTAMCFTIGIYSYIHISGHASDQSPSRPPVRPKPLDGAIHPDEYRAPKEGRQRL